MTTLQDVPFGGAGLSGDERARGFLARCLELVALSEKERARALEAGTDLPLHWGDRFAMAASRWGVLPRD